MPSIDERRLRTLRLLGVTHLLAPPESAGAPPAGLDTPGLTRVYNGPDAQVFRVDGALPRAFVAGAQQTVDDGDAALDAVTSPSLDARDVAVTERSALPRQPSPGSGGASPGWHPRGSSRYEPDRVTIDANLTRPGVVVLGDNWYPGWKAKVDGQPVDVERVDYVLRGTVAGRGHHRDRVQLPAGELADRLDHQPALAARARARGRRAGERGGRERVMPARRPTLVAALISLALAAVMVGPGLVPGRVLSSADIWWFSVAVGG